MRQRLSDLLRILVVGGVLASVTSVAGAVAQDSPVDDESQISGRVVDVDGTPVENASVTFDGARGYYVETGADGRYDVELESGDYIVYFNGDDRHIAGVRLADGSVSQTSASLLVVPEASVLSNVDLLVDRFPTVKGRLIDSVGGPVENANIGVEGFDSTVIVSPNGEYELIVQSSVPIQGYLFATWAEGLVYYPDQLSSSEGSIVELARNDQLTGYDMQFPAPAAVGGTVVDVSGDPVVGGSITLYRVGGGYEYYATTDAEGKWLVPALVAGEYGVYFHGAGRYLDGNRLSDGSISDNQFESLDVPVGAELLNVDMRADRYPTISGRTIDADGVPVAGAMIRPVGGGNTAVSASDGSYELVIAERFLPVAVEIMATSAADTSYYGGPTPGDAQRILVDANDELSGLDIVFPLAGGLLCNGLAVTVDFGAGDVPTDGADVILGTDGMDWIDGRGGDDVICGLGGSDLIAGGAGNDVIFGGDGFDWIGGGPGNDWIYGEGGDDALGGGPDGDILIGGPGEDALAGHGGADIILGGTSNDWLSGGSENDWLVGQAGFDECDGGGDVADWVHTCEPVAG